MAKWRRVVALSMEGRVPELPWLLLACYPSSTWSSLPAQKLSNAVKEFSKEVSLHTYDWLNHWALMMELNLQLFFLTGRWGFPGSSSPDRFLSQQPSFWSCLGVHKTHLISINSGVVESDLPWLTNPLLSLRKFKGFGELCSWKQRERPNIFCWWFLDHTYGCGYVWALWKQPVLSLLIWINKE